MKQKFVAMLVTMMAMCALAGCGNYTMLDTTYTYRYAIIALPDGTVVKGEVEKWCDYEGEQLQVTINGQTYLTSSFNCVMMTNIPE
jgi:hypothetical protein